MKGENITPKTDQFAFCFLVLGRNLCAPCTPRLFRVHFHEFTSDGRLFRPATESHVQMCMWGVEGTMQRTGVLWYSF